MNERIAIIGIIVESDFKVLDKVAQVNELLADYTQNWRGISVTPFPEKNITVISVVISGSLDIINALTGKLGNVEGVTVKTSISKNEF